MTKQTPKQVSKGESLAATLNNEMEEQASEDRSLRDIKEDMASEAGISASTVGQILRGEINCPPASRLEGFARALNVSATSLMESGEQDGCDYSNDKIVIETTNKVAERVFTRLEDYFSHD